jgi:hypothetical protein
VHHWAAESLSVFEVTMLAYLFVLLAVAVRLFGALTRQYALTAVGASLLYFGAKGPRKQWWIAAGILAATDLALTLFVYHYSFTADHLVSILWYAGAIWFGTLLRNKVTITRIIGASLVLAVSFFLVSNLASWATYRDLYPLTWGGLMASYAAGLPFFRRDLIGDLFFSGVFFGLPAAARALSAAMHRRADHQTAA